MNCTIYRICKCAVLCIVSITLLSGRIIGMDRPDIVTLETNAIAKARVWEKRSILDAIGLFAKCAKEWATFGEYANAVSCEHEAAKLESTDARYGDAIDRLKSALQLAESHRLSDQEIITLSLLSLLNLEKGDKRASWHYSEKASVLVTDKSSPTAAAYSLFSRGMFQYYHDTMSNAIDTLEKATIASHNVNEPTFKSQVLQYLAYSYLRTGEFNRAEEMMNSALSECSAAENARCIALSYFGLAFVKYFGNEKQLALEFFRRSDAMFPKDFEWLERSRILNAMGQIHLDYGDLDLAEYYFLGSIPFYEKADYSLGKLTTLTSLAEVYLLQPDLQKARDTLILTEQLARESGDELRIAVTKQGFGNLASLEGNFDSAIKDYKEASRIFDEIGVKFSDLYNLIGLAYTNKHDYKSARDHFGSGLKLNRKSKDHIQLSENLYNLARLDLLENRSENALEKIRESIRLSEDLGSSVPHPSLKRALYSSSSRKYEFYISLLMSRRQDEDARIGALKAKESSIARTMLENLSTQGVDFTADADPGLVRTEFELNTSLNATLNRLTDLLNSDGNPDEAKGVEHTILGLEIQLSEIRAQLKLASPIYSAIKNPEPFDVERFQADVLDEDSVLLQFSLGAEESYLWVVDKLDVTSYYLPARERIETRVDKLRSLLASRQFMKGESLEAYQKRLADAESEYETEARNLSSELLGEAKDKLAGKKLIVVADGRLHYFPLGALPMPGSGGDEPILLTNEVVYSPSASALEVLRMERRFARKPTKDLLVFADPVFSKSDERIAGLDTNSGVLATVLSPFRSIESLESMPRLPASEQEAISISDVVGRDRATVRSGFEANRDGVLNGGIEEYKVLHFATHGLIDEKRPELSGILLSLYNKEGKQPEGGFIRLQDVYGMRLNSDLVVLSACDTGLGQEIKGEGVMSLNNAFLQAGARSVVSSLWKVDDNATKDLMTEFYRGMADDGLTAAAALRQAQIRMYNDPRYNSPFYWAAFTASGDNRVKVAFASNVRLYIVTATSTILAAILILVGVRRQSRRRELQNSARQ